MKRTINKSHKEQLKREMKSQSTKNIFLTLLLSVIVLIVYVVAFEYSSSSLSLKKHNEIKTNYEVAKAFYVQGEYDKSLQYIYPIIITKDDPYSLKAIKLLAVMYENGHGFEKNLIKSKKLYNESDSSKVNTDLNLPYSNILSYNYLNKIFMFIALCLIIIYSSKKILFLSIVIPATLLIYNPFFEYNILHQEMIYFYFYSNSLNPFSSSSTFFTPFNLCIILFVITDFKAARPLVIRFLKLIDNIRSLSNIKKYENENRNITIVFLSYRKQYIDSITTLEYLKEETKKMLIESYLLSLVKHATKRSWDLNVKSCDGFNLLSLAIYFGYDEIVNYIAKLDIDVNEKVTIKSDFDLFIKIENKDSLDLVFEENCEIYPIEIAARHYNTDIIKLLLKHGAKSVDNNIYDVLSGARQENGWSTIELIGAIGDADLIKHLLDNGYKNNIDELLQPATDNLKYEACKVLLECRDTSSPLVTYLGRPIIHKKIELLKLFVEHGIILDEKECIKSNELFTNSKSYLTICIECQDKEEDQITYYEIAQYLIENGVDLNYKNPLINTLKHKWKTTDESYIRMDHKMFYLLADNGADIHYVDEDTGETILMAVCRSSYFMDSSKVQKINKDNNFNITYFMNKGAVTEDLKDIKTNIIKYLINKGIDINIKDNDNNTALMAIETARAEHVVFIIDKNGYIYFDIDDNAESKYYYTEPKNAQIAKILIENGAKLNIKNNLGYTPLMIYSSRSGKAIIKYLLEQGANINTKIEVTASSLAQNEEIKEMIDDSKNNNPQRLVKLLSNFTIDKPIKYTTHSWDFGDLKKEYGNFDGYMSAVKKQFDSMKSELEELSPNLYKKISTFLIETTPDENYSWCSKTSINIGWSSLEGLKEHCDGGKNPFDFRLPKSIFMGRKQLATFGEVINLFKQEIEIRDNFKNLENLFANQIGNLGENFRLDLSTAKLGRQFYTDTQKFSSVLDKIFADMGTRKEYPNITVTTTELEDRSIEIKIIQLDSNSSRSADELLERVKEAGDIEQIKESLTNLCDWSVESCYDEQSFRVNFLHSNNVKEIVPLETKTDGFTHILRFYK